MPDISVLAVAACGVCLIAFMKGAFGGGFAIIGIPLLSLVMDPLAAGTLLAPLFVVMDACALYYWRPDTWSKIDLLWMLPGLAAGIGLGFLTLKVADGHAIAILMAAIILFYIALWLKGGGRILERPRQGAKALFAGTASGISSMVAHSGGPPAAMYLLTLGLPKAVYAGTLSTFFAVGNALKAGPWLVIGRPTVDLWILMGLCLPVIPLGVWAGYRLHERLNQQQLYRLCYALLFVTALKLLWDGLHGYGLI
jgi:uncharacterized membrane protein YfcA